MADNSKIEWTDATWSPVTGCSIVSPGCTHCYAMKLAGTRLKHHPSRKGLTTMAKTGPVWNGKVRLNENWLTQPLRWKRPRMIFVCAHADLAHEGVPDKWLHYVFAVMALAQHHTFQVLTKRSARLRDYLNHPDTPGNIMHAAHKFGVTADGEDGPWGAISLDRPKHQWTLNWPLPNVWLGVSAERQKEADARIPDLLLTPAAVRFVSLEPLLGPIDLTNIGGSTAAHGINAITEHNRVLRGVLDWIIVGGESGDGARPMHPAWVRSLRDQCAAAGKLDRFFFKQWGAWLPGHHYTDELKEFDSDPHQSLFPCMDWNGDEAFETDGLAGWDDLGDDAMWCVGKKRAGRLLDAVEHNGIPA
jgi:protein gp37